MPYCPKKTKKPKFGDLQALEEPKVSKLGFCFFCFFGTVQHFCTFCLKKFGFFGTVQHFRGLGLQKRCAVPKKAILLSKSKQKCRTVPKKPKKPKFGDLQALEEPKVWFFFGFFGTVQHFCTFCLKKIGFFGTVQHFRGLGLQKCCTVPKKPIFLSKNKQKCRTVPKKPKFGDLQVLEEPKVSKLWFFFWFFWDSTAFLHFLP